MGVVAREPIPYSGTGWRRGGPVKICVYLSLLCSDGGNNTQKKKLNVTEADRAMTPGTWGACSRSEI